MEINKLMVEESIIELTDMIIDKERYLKYAKDAATVNSLCDEIALLRTERDIYLRLL